VHADHARQQRRAHDTPAAGAGPLVQRGDDTERAVHARDQVRDRDADLGRLAGAGDRHQPALTLGDLVVAGSRRLRPVVPEPGDRQDDEAGVQLVQPRDREAQPVEDPDPEVLHQHVGPGHQPRQDVAVLG
jgi:hypothetical protein